jgi:anti-sigma regulatory factor (Ser/Thr protein kinase)
MPGAPQRIDDFSVSLPADTSVIGEARRGFTAWLRRWVLDEDAVDDLVLVLSELLANAVRATQPDRTRVQVLASAEGGDVVLEVRNARTTWIDADNRWDLSDPLRAGGRGLMIVESLVDHVAVEHDDRAGITTVRSRRTVH